jgi:hypothetical protein
MVSYLPRMPQPPNFSQRTANSSSPNLLTANVQPMKWAGDQRGGPRDQKLHTFTALQWSRQSRWTYLDVPLHLHGAMKSLPSVSRQIRHWNWSPAPASMSISDGGGISGDDSDADDAAPRAGCSPIDDPPQPAPALLQPSSSSHPNP